MCDFTKYLPVDVNELIAKKVDLKSYPNFMATCKSTRSNITQQDYLENVVKNVETRLNNMIEVVKDYNTALNDKEARRRIGDTLLKAMNSKLMKHKGSFTREVYDDMGCIYEAVKKNIQTTDEEIHKVWIHHTRGLPYDDSLLPVLDELRNVVIIKNNIYYQKISYRDGDDRLILNFIYGFPNDELWIKFYCKTQGQDMYTDIRNGHDYIPEATVAPQGPWISFKVTPQHIKGLAELIVYRVGVDTMMLGTHHVSTLRRWCKSYIISDETYQDAFDNVVNQKSYRKKFLNILG